MWFAGWVLPMLSAFHQVSEPRQLWHKYIRHNRHNSASHDTVVSILCDGDVVLCVRFVCAVTVLELVMFALHVYYACACSLVCAFNVV